MNPGLLCLQKIYSNIGKIPTTFKENEIYGSGQIMITLRKIQGANLGVISRKCPVFFEIRILRLKNKTKPKNNKQTKNSISKLY